MWKSIFITADNEYNSLSGLWDIHYEIGPDETLEATEDTAVLVEKIIGEEEVEKMDSLLSLAITGGDYNWI